MDIRCPTRSPLAWGKLEESDPQNRKLMEAVDRINQKMGRKTIQIAAEGIEQDWAMQRGRRSPRYTTRWAEVPVTHC